MCSKYSFVAAQDDIEDTFLVAIPQVLKTSYHIAPTQSAYVITNKEPQKLNYFIWGMIPAFSQSGENTGRLIHARKENISSQSSFRLPIRSQRCLVLADSFYEYKRTGHLKKPYRIKLRSGKLMLMAGIWDEYKERGNSIRSFSIITTPANKEMKEISNRMPVIFSTKEEQQEWLSQLDLRKTLYKLRTLPDDTLYMYRVSSKIDDPNYNTRQLHQNIIK